MATRFRVRYYETDAMGIVHHSNYIRWFELARTEQMRTLSVTYREMEEDGISMPVLDVYCRYDKPARYDDEIDIHVTMTNYTGTRVTFSYAVMRGDEQLCVGTSSHAFLIDGRPVSLARKAPAYHDIFQLAWAQATTT